MRADNKRKVEGRPDSLRCVGRSDDINRMGKGRFERLRWVTRAVEKITSVIQNKEIILMGMKRRNRTKRKIWFIESDMAGDDNLIGVKVKTTKTFMISGISKEYTWDRTRLKFVSFVYMKEAMASKNTKVRI